MSQNNFSGLLIEGVPPLVTWILGITTLGLGSLNGYFIYRQKVWQQTIKAAETTISVAEQARDAVSAEMQIHKETCERLRKEKDEALITVGQLQKQTDLGPLTEMIAAWISEGRERFADARARLDMIKQEQTLTLAAMLEELKAQRSTSEDAYRQMVNTLSQHTLEDRQFQYHHLTILDALERRLSDVAVRVGVTSWSSPLQMPIHPPDEPTTKA